VSLLISLLTVDEGGDLSTEFRIGMDSDAPVKVDTRVGWVKILDAASKLMEDTDVEDGKGSAARNESEGEGLY
jgi:hypothetical protein